LRAAPIGIPVLAVAWVISLAVINRSFIITLQEATARDLQTDISSLFALKEAWLLQGGMAKLTETKGLSEEPNVQGLWLMPVEIRAVLDEAQWNVPDSTDSYGFLNGRRAWIVRNEINGELAYPGGTRMHYPALLSSKGLDLCKWIERVQLAYRTGLLNELGRATIKDYLIALAPDDRVRVLKNYCFVALSPDSVQFLADFQKRLSSGKSW
jgi:hypothetical protein